MLGNLVRSEFRKVLSVKMWWALLIPAVAVGFLFNLFASSINGDADLSNDGISGTIPAALISLGLSFSFTSIFAAIYGAMSVSGEFRARTITTTFLVSKTRGLALGAKLVVYTVMGLGYGILTLLFCSLGALAGDGPSGFPTMGSWLLISLVGVVVITLWMLLGVGFGSLLKNQIAAVVTLLAYGMIGENVIGLFFTSAGAPAANNYLPVGSSTASVVGLALNRFAGEFDVNGGTADFRQIEDAFGRADLPNWWVALLVFAGYTAVFIGLGWLAGQKRDIT
jgi:ABC-2 type transport system permease protein